MLLIFFVMRDSKFSCEKFSCNEGTRVKSEIKCVKILFIAQYLAEVRLYVDFSISTTEIFLLKESSS